MIEKDQIIKEIELAIERLEDLLDEIYSNNIDDLDSLKSDIKHINDILWLWS